MTATEELRRMLDERGVRWWEEDGHTLWYGQSINHAASAFSSFMLGENDKVHLSAMVTPEQAIEATLGETPTPPQPTPPKQPPYDELIESLRRDWDIEASWDGLRRFWYIGLTDEGVRKRDEREATLELGTCRDLAETPKYGDKTRFECSACGYEYSAVGGFGCDYGDEPDFNYCPNCGRRVEQ